MTAAAALERSVVADAESVARLREEFSCWLRDFGLSAVRHNDLVLAVNEALANAAEFAYLGGRPGRVNLSARHDTAGRAIIVTIADHGRWRESGPAAVPQLRGRGIPLMRALADHVAIAKSDAGTTVSLSFEGIRGLAANA